MRPVLWSSLLLAAAAAGVLVATTGGCGPEPAPATPGPDDVVVRVGDLEFTWRELDEDFEFLRRTDPSLAPGYIRWVQLMDDLIPRRLAARLIDPAAVAEGRHKAEDLARTVQEAGGTVEDLRRFGAPLGGAEAPYSLTRVNDLETIAAKSVFSLDIGQASGAIHGAFGSYVLAPTEELHGVAAANRSRKIYVVYFTYAADARTRVLAEARKYRSMPLEVHPSLLRELEPQAAKIRVLDEETR
ncbi:MAG: hypothetical protein R3F30_05585 [Planctomycetota bacterium]